jgi:hypothetical protein
LMSRRNLGNDEQSRAGISGELFAWCLQQWWIQNSHLEWLRYVFDSLKWFI